MSRLFDSPDLMVTCSVLQMTRRLKAIDSASRGLSPYAVFEVRIPQGICQLERMNSVHRYHNPTVFEGTPAFYFRLYDSVFERVAGGLEVSTHAGSLLSSVELAPDAETGSHLSKGRVESLGDEIPINDLAPSILAADFARLGEQVQAGRGRRRGTHSRRRDGRPLRADSHLVLNREVAEAGDEAATRTHLMIDNPDHFLEAFAAAGSTTLIVHWKTSTCTAPSTRSAASA